MLSEEHILRAGVNRVLREIFVVERNWETVDCRSLHSGKILILVLLTEYYWMRCAGNLGGIGEDRAYRIIWGDLSERSNLVELGIHKMKLFKLIFKK